MWDFFQAGILECVAIFSHFPDPGIKPVSPVFPALQADSLLAEPQWSSNGSQNQPKGKKKKNTKKKKKQQVEPDMER